MGKNDLQFWGKTSCKKHPPGIEGVVDFVDDIGTLHCNFENGRSLGVIVGEDSFSVIEPEEEQGMSLTMK